MEKTYSSTWQRHKAGECTKDCWYCKQEEKEKEKE